MSGLFLNHLPPTEEGAKLSLSREQEENLRVVYKLDEHRNAVFYDFWNPNEEYSKEYVILPLRSVYVGLSEVIPVGTPFANIKGSTGDCPNNEQYGSWIELLRQELGEENCESCCTDGNRYDSYTGECVKDGFICNDNMVGGHVLINAYSASVVLPGSAVAILPICSHHNSSSLHKAGNGCGFFMSLDKEMYAAMMYGYLPNQTLRIDEMF